MKPEILLKIYVQHQSEDAFRDLVSRSLDEVYSRAFRITNGATHLAEEIVLRVYVELAQKAHRLSEDTMLEPWLREHTCKIAVTVLRKEDRVVDRSLLKRESESPPSPTSMQPAPTGLAFRVCQGIFLSPQHKGSGSFFLHVWRSIRIRPWHVGGAAVCLLIIVVLWKNPFHRGNAIVKSPELRMTPASFAQLGSPEEGGSPPSQTVNTNAEPHPNQR